MDNMKNYDLVQKHIGKIIPRLQHPSGRNFPYPWISPAYGIPYDDAQYAWDAFHEALRFAHSGDFKWLRFVIDNHLTYQDSRTGWVPVVIRSKGGAVPGDGSVAQPFLIQGALIYVRSTGDRKWLKSRYAQLKLCLRFFDDKRRLQDNLYGWAFESGCDNDVATVFHPPRSILCVHASCLLYLEHLAMSKLAGEMHKTDDEVAHSSAADRIRTEINKNLWNRKMSTYVNLCVTTGKVLLSLDLGRRFSRSSIGRYAFFPWTYLFPLYARIVPRERARRIIEAYVLNPDHFWSPHGVRSLSKASEYYNNAVWGNPPRYSDSANMTASNWQGPVWIIVNYLLFHGLLNYGYRDAARKLADKTINILAGSIRTKGCMFENYDAETGEPLYAPQFGSWNILADVMDTRLRQGNSLYDHVWN